MFNTRYWIDWLPITLKLLRLNADREASAPDQPITSMRFFR